MKCCVAVSLGALLLIILGFGGNAWAQSIDADGASGLSKLASPKEEGGDQAAISQAAEHFRAGLRYVRRRRWQDALQEFDASLALQSTDVALYNRAQCLDLLGRSAEAMNAYDQYLRRYGNDIDRRRQREVDGFMTKLRARVGHLTITVEEPEGALVELDGAEIAAEARSSPIYLDPGDHRVEVRAEGFEPFSRQVSLGAGQELEVRASLERAGPPTALRIDVRLPGAAVTVDGQAVGRAPLAEPVPVEPGAHVIEVSHPGYETARREITAVLSQETEVVLALSPASGLPPDQVGRVELDVSERRAEVLLDGHPLPVTPIPIGTHLLEVRRDGFEPWSQEIEVTSGEPQSVEVTLRPTEAYRTGYESRARTLRIVAWSATGLAVASLGSGLGLLLWNNGRYSSWDQEDGELSALYAEPTTDISDPTLWSRVRENNDAADSVQAVGVVSWVLLGLGIASTGAALALFFAGPRPGRYANVAFVPGPGSFALAASW